MSNQCNRCGMVKENLHGAFGPVCTCEHTQSLPTTIVHGGSDGVEEEISAFKHHAHEQEINKYKTKLRIAIQSLTKYADPQQWNEGREGHQYKQNYATSREHGWMEAETALQSIEILDRQRDY